ncbi:MAG: DUF5074 domain-containing protein [Flavobacteriaceae bacterium]|jgi:hypothetical protein|nr:DUF5074 domain-containing protein [Flavobacteriaceae bacterium]
MKKINLAIIMFCISFGISAQNQLTKNLPPLKGSVALKNAKTEETPVDYTKGVFFVNEDWFGHNNSTVNFLSDEGTWAYRIFKKENPGHELGCTTQYGAIYGGKFYLVSKQYQDVGAKVPGSRLAVCDATTMKLIKEFEYFGKNANGVSIADGRSFLGVDEHKGYIGTSNGIFTFDIDNMTIGSQIPGTTSNTGGLYSAQIGTMLRAADKVFAVHQKEGLLVIDPVKDEVITTIQAPKDGTLQRGFGSVVQSKDGILWLSVAENQSGGGGSCDYMIRLDPWTLDSTRVSLPAGMQIPNSWYAWTADGFFSSTAENKIYWKNNGGWFNARRIICYDIDKKEFKEIINTGTIDKKKDWGIYGASVRIHPVTDEIYASLFKQFNDPEYITIRMNKEGKILQTYEMEQNYWFPAMPVFPDNYDPAIELSELTVYQDTIISLNDKILDKDNMSVAIVKSLTGVDNALIDASIYRDALKITRKVAEGKTKFTLKVNSNGKLLEKEIIVNIITLTSPKITQQPVSISKYYGESATFSLTAEGGLLSYQWYKDGVAIEGADQPSYTIADTNLNNASQGEYYCEVSNLKGKVVSEKATLTVLGNILSKVEIDGEEWDITKTYVVPEGKAGSHLTVELFPVNSNIEVYYGGTLLSDNTYKVSLSQPFHKVYTFTLKAGSGFSVNYGVTIEKRFNFDDIVVTRWNNSLIVNDNSTTNGGFDFVGYKWFKDGAEIGIGQYYSAGQKKTDLLSGNYEVQLITKDGQTLRTWNKSIALKSSTGLKAYPNPLQKGESVSVQLDIDPELLTDAVIEVYNINGAKISSVKAVGAVTPVALPASSGTYIIKVRSGEFSETQKLIVK